LSYELVLNCNLNLPNQASSDIGFGVIPSPDILMAHRITTCRDILTSEFRPLKIRWGVCSTW